MKTITRFSLSILSIILIASCTKEGPAGPAGPAGAQGNANVTPSTYSVSYWNNDGISYYANLSVSALTSTIQDGGGVEVFMSVDGGLDWIAMPFTQYGSFNDYLAVYITSDYNVQIQWTNNGSGLGSDPNSYYGITATDFKVVCIAPAAMKKHPNTNWKDYNQVKAILDAQID